MPFDNIISRANADALIPVQVVNEVVAGLTQQSAAMQLFRRINMSAKQSKVPVVSELPVAYFVNGDTGLKQTTEVNWDSAVLEAEEIASIVPIAENVLDDSQFPIWPMVRDKLTEAVGRTLDAAILSGIGKPSSWADAIVPTAIDRGNVVEATSTPAAGSILADLGDLLSVVEDGGREPSGWVAARRLRGRLRRARTATGELQADMNLDSAWSLPFTWALAETLPGNVLSVAGDFSLGLLGVRQDMRFKVLDQAVISDDQGRIVYNLPQQDMLALRVTSRFAWCVAEPIVRTDDGEPGYPFAILTEGDDDSTRTAAAERKAPEPKAEPEPAPKRPSSPKR